MSEIKYPNYEPIIDPQLAQMEHIAELKALLQEARLLFIMKYAAIGNKENEEIDNRVANWISRIDAMEKSL